MLTRNTGPISLITYLLVMQNFSWSYKFFFNMTRKTLQKTHRQHVFLFILCSFISEIFGALPEGNLPELISARLTLSCLEIFLTSVVWTFDIFENYIGIYYKFTRHLKESCSKCFDQHFSFKYFIKIAIY